jgi:hypothetical protein
MVHFARKNASNLIADFFGAVVKFLAPPARSLL